MFGFWSFALSFKSFLDWCHNFLWKVSVSVTDKKKVFIMNNNTSKKEVIVKESPSEFFAT